MMPKNMMLTPFSGDRVRNKGPLTSPTTPFPFSPKGLAFMIGSIIYLHNQVRNRFIIQSLPLPKTYLQLVPTSAPFIFYWLPPFNRHLFCPGSALITPPSSLLKGSSASPAGCNPSPSTACVPPPPAPPPAPP